MRHLRPAYPGDPGPTRLILMESEGTEIVSYQARRSFRRIERDGRWFRLAGADRATGEMIYLPEVTP